MNNIVTDPFGNTGTITAGGASVTWSNGRTDTFLPTTSISTLNSPNCIIGMCLVSPSQFYEMCQQLSDGNLVMYTVPGNVPIWATMVYGPWYANSWLCVNNGSIYAASTYYGTYWSSGTSGGTGPWHATMNDNSNFVLYDANNNVMWQTGIIPGH